MGDLQPEDPQEPVGPESAEADTAAARETWPHADAAQEPESAWPAGLGGAPQAAERGIDPEPDQRARIFVAAAIIVVVAAVALSFVLIKLNAKTTVSPGPSLSNSHAGAAPTAVIGQVTSVPVSALNAVGNGGGAVTTRPIAVSGTALTLHGKPEMFYLGAEFCPFCAVERWPMIVALSRFGTFSGLSIIRSAAADGAGDAEPYPNTATWTFAKTSYSSPYLTFTPVEELTNIPDPSTGSYTTLETPTQAQVALLARYDAPPYVPADLVGSIPFIDFGNKYAIVGASYSPQVLAGLSWSQIAGDLSNPSSPVAMAIDGTANYITAAICAMTGNQPASACASFARSPGGSAPVLS